jgi:hypothetical protein
MHLEIYPFLQDFPVQAAWSARLGWGRRRGPRPGRGQRNRWEGRSFTEGSGGAAQLPLSPDFLAAARVGGDLVMERFLVSH